MIEYEMVPDELLGYGVELMSPNRFLSVRGFATVQDARVWIAAQKASEEVATEAAEWDSAGGKMV